MIGSIKNKVLFDPVILGYCILIFATIFNANKYHAAIKYIFPALGLGIIFLFLKLSFERDKLLDYIPILLICISTALSTLYSDVVGWTMIVTSFMIFAGLYVLLTIRNFSADQIQTILKFYAYFTLILSVLLLMNFLLSHNMVGGRVSISILGVRKDENYLSAYLAFGFFYFMASYFWGSQKKKYVLYSALIFIAVFMTGSRGGLVAMLVSVLLMIIKYMFFQRIRLRTFLLMIGIAVGIVVIYLFLKETPLFSRMSDSEGYTENIRLVIWGYAMEGFYRRPWIGSGIQAGTFFAQQHVRWFTHSCYVDLITSVGLIGAALYVWQYVKFCRVKHENLLFILSLTAVLFVPLMFVNGLETLTFWMPMSICKIISDFCKENEFNEILA